LELEIDRRIGALSAVMRALFRSVEVKRELSWKEKLSVYCLCSNPHLWSQIWVVIQGMRSWIQAAEMSFLQRGAGLSLRDVVEPLLLHMERSQLR